MKLGRVTDWSLLPDSAPSVSTIKNKYYKYITNYKSLMQSGGSPPFQDHDLGTLNPDPNLNQGSAESLTLLHLIYKQDIMI